MTRAGQNGQFNFSNITPGEYTLQARVNVREGGAEVNTVVGGRAGRGGGAGLIQVLWAASQVSVGGQDMTDVNLTLQPGMSVTGHVEFRGAAAPPGDLSRARISLTSRSGDTFADLGAVAPVQADSTGRFTLKGVPPGHYTITAAFAGGQEGGGRARGAGPGGALPAGAGMSGQWTLASSVANGRDTLDFPLEVAPNSDVTNAVLTFTDRVQELSGTIQDVAGRPTAEYTIIVFPADNRYWVPQARRITSTRPDTTGRFSLRSLPPGDYRLTAVTDVEPGEWYDPTFLAQLQQVSIPITLAEGERKTQDIRLAGQ
jgi:protocatechuate 3,4-dioxygenase beta subunit